MFDDADYTPVWKQDLSRFPDYWLKNMLVNVEEQENYEACAYYRDELLKRANA